MDKPVGGREIKALFQLISMKQNIYRINEDFFDDAEITSVDDMVDDKKSNRSTGTYDSGYTCCFCFDVTPFTLLDEINKTVLDVYTVRNRLEKFMSCMSFVDEYDIQIMFGLKAVYIQEFYANPDNMEVDVTDYIDEQHHNISSYFGNIIKLFVNSECKMTDEEVFTDQRAKFTKMGYKFNVYVKPNVVSGRKLYASIVKFLGVRKANMMFRDTVNVYRVNNGGIDASSYISLSSNDNITGVKMSELCEFLFGGDGGVSEDICDIVARKYNIDATVRDIIGMLKIDIDRWGYRIMNVNPKNGEYPSGTLPVIVVDVLPKTIGSVTREYVVTTIWKYLNKKRELCNTTNKFNICFRFWPIRKTVKIDFDEYQPVYSSVWNNYTYTLSGQLASNGHSITLKNINRLCAPLQNVFIAFPQMDGSLMKAGLSLFAYNANDVWLNKLFTAQENPEKYFFDEQNA